MTNTADRALQPSFLSLSPPSSFPASKKQDYWREGFLLAIVLFQMCLQLPLRGEASATALLGTGLRAWATMQTLVWPKVVYGGELATAALIVTLLTQAVFAL